MLALAGLRAAAPPGGTLLAAGCWPAATVGVGQGCAGSPHGGRTDEAASAGCQLVVAAVCKPAGTAPPSPTAAARRAEAAGAAASGEAAAARRRPSAEPAAAAVAKGVVAAELTVAELGAEALLRSRPEFAVAVVETESGGLGCGRSSSK